MTLAFAVVLLASCGNRRGDGEKLPKVKDKVLVETLDSLSQQNFDSFYSKMSTQYKDSSRNVSIAV